MLIPWYMSCFDKYRHSHCYMLEQTCLQDFKTVYINIRQKLEIEEVGFCYKYCDFHWLVWICTLLEMEWSVISCISFSFFSLYSISYPLCITLLAVPYSEICWSFIFSAICFFHLNLHFHLQHVQNFELKNFLLWWKQC